MNKIEVQHYKKVKLENIIFYKPTENTFDLKNYISKCRYVGKDNNKKKFFIQTPKLKIDSDLVYDKITNSFKFDCLFSKKQPEFYNFFYSFEKFLIGHIAKNSEKWFGIKFDKSKTEKLFRSKILPPEYLSSLPKLLLDIKIIDGSINCKFFDEYDKLTTADKFTKGKETIFILSLNEIIFEEDNFYANWKINQIKIFENQVNKNKYMFIDDENISDEETEYIYDIIDSEIKDSLSEMSNIVSNPITKNIPKDQII